MLGDIEMYQTSGSDLEGNEYIQDAEAGRYENKEVASYDLVRIISEERGPPLAARSRWAWLALNVLADRARGELNLEFQREFVCNSLFAPGRIFRCHAADQAPDLGRDLGRPTGLDFQRQKQRKTVRCQLIRGNSSLARGARLAGESGFAFRVMHCGDFVKIGVCDRKAFTTSLGPYEQGGGVQFDHDEVAAKSAPRLTDEFAGNGSHRDTLL